jgi:fibronectin type 3 domain-containing protein
LTAQAKAEGVTLTWSAPATAVDGTDGPIVSGYNIYRSAPGTEPGELDVAINNAPVKETTYRDTPSYGEHQYRVSAVAAPGVESDPSPAARVEFRDLVPPPAPATVTPLIEPNAIRLIWDPVEAPDLAGYRIYRTEGVGHTDIREVGTINLVQQPITETTWLNKPVSLGLQFRYAVTAVDTSGNESEKTWTGWIVAPKTP